MPRVPLLPVLLLLALPAAAIEPVVISSVTAPLVEVGVFSGAGRVPDYPGANQAHGRFLAFPFILFRGKVVRTDDQSGVKARMLKRDRFDLDLGFAGSFPVNSSDNDARHGMPDLDWLAEVGPRASILLARLADGGTCKLLLPVRAVLGTDFHHLQDRGYVFAPTLSLELPRLLPKEWFTLAQITSNFGTHRITSYFYEVAGQYATPDRPAYQARAGYMGSHLFVGFGSPKRFRMRFFSGAEFSFYQGSANLASPLFKSQYGTTLIAGITWVFFKSLKPGYE